MIKDYYNILGVERNANEKEIKTAYRKLALKYHPDRNDGVDSDDSFKKIAEAYSILSDPQKRSNYDNPEVSNFNVNTDGFPRYGFDDVFRDFGDIFGAAFSGGRSYRPAGASRQTHSANRQYKTNLKIDFKEAISGVNKKIKINYEEPCSLCLGSGGNIQAGEKDCPNCKGSGRVQRHQGGYVYISAGCADCGGSGKMSVQKCRKCNGTGGLETTEELKLTIPAGIKNGDVLRITRDDSTVILISIQVGVSKEFRREGSSIISELEISVTKAMLGFEKEIRLVSGTHNVKIPPGVSNGTKLRIKGGGVPDLRTKALGDHFVEIKIKIPTSLTDKQKALVKKLDKLL